MTLMTDSPNIAQDLFPNLYTFIAHLIATFIILFFLIFFVWKPFKKFLKNRNQHISDNISISETKRKQSEINHKEQLEALTAARIQAIKIVEQSKQNAYVESENIVKHASKHAARLLNDARTNIISERIHSEDKIKKEIVNSATLMTEKLLNREISQKDNEAIINHFISELEGTEGE